MPPRLFVPHVLGAGAEIALGDGATRHAQVLRLQPGDEVTLFDGSGGEWRSRISAMSKRETRAVAIEHRAIERELPLAVALALAMPAGERMDFVVEKATELGAVAVQPLTSERSVLRLGGERAQKRQAHWQAIAVAACEQCGRNRVPRIGTPTALDAWLAALPDAASSARLLLGWRDAQPWRSPATAEVLVLSGPEGGFTEHEEALARARGFVATTLGERVLRADTAPLAALASLALCS